ncbi:MAG: hypothetical protein Q8N73_01675 [bacterium]|nr:hypothetical protein [bacterium]
MSNKSFTLVELLVIVGILVVLTALAIPNFRFFERESDLNNSAQEIINTLRLAQNKTLASEGANSWGVFFATSTSPHQYVLFQGSDYLSRATSSDEVRKLPTAIIISEINLSGDKKEVVFDRLTGTTNKSGSISLELKTDSAKNRKIYIENSGQVQLISSPIPSDENRIKDSRHLHIDYTKTISTPTENLILTFEGGVTETIVIANNIKDGQIYWEGEVDVAGEIQKLKIQTHRLNDPILGTQFSVHRDRRYNTKSLKIELSGDTSGSLIEYSADGLTTTKTSIYVSDLQWQ